MSVAWKLAYNGELKPLAEWGLSEVRRELRSGARDAVTFLEAGPLYDANDLFAPDSIVQLYRDDSLWFTGRAQRPTRAVTPNAEAKRYTLFGPWYDLEQIKFAQLWYAALGAPATTIYNGRILLNREFPQARDQLIQIIDYAIGSEANLQRGLILPEADESPLLPVDEDRDITCAQAILKQLYWVHDAVSWFDYTTDPPTLHIRRRPKLTAKTLQIGPDEDGSALVTAHDIAPRDDLVRPSVVITYEVTGTEDGREYMNYVLDKWPLSATGREFGALTPTIELIGAQVNNLSADTYTEFIDHRNPEWWKRKFPYLSRTDLISDLSFEFDDFRSGILNLPNELLEGQVADWFTVNQQQVFSEQDEVRCKVSYKLKHTPGAGIDPDVMEVFRIPLTVKLVTTNAPVGLWTFTAVESFTTGDPQPIDLARFLFDLFAAIHWQGSITLTEEELTSPVSVGHRLNLTGGRAEWSTMNARVEAVIEEIDSGTTQIAFGPPPEVSARDLVELMKVTRPRLRLTPSTRQTNGQISALSINLGRQTANTNSIPLAGDGPMAKLQVGNTGNKGVLTTANGSQTKIDLKHDNFVVLVDAANKKVTITDGAGKSILLDIAHLTGAGAPASLTAQLRETDICVDGQTRRCLVLRTETWDVPPR